MILNDFIWELPILKLACHNEGFKFLHEKCLNLLVLEEPEKILEKEVTVTKLNAKLNCNADESLKLLLLFIFKLLELLKIDLNLIF